MKLSASIGVFVAPLLPVYLAKRDDMGMYGNQLENTVRPWLDDTAAILYPVRYSL